MFRATAFAFLCLAAAPAFAQNQTTPPPAGPPPAAMNAIQQAGMAFGQCIQSGVLALPATVTPEAGAPTVLSGCATQQGALVSAVNALIATLPADQQAMAQEQMRSRMASAETEIANAIRQARAGAAAAPAPTPAP